MTIYGLTHPTSTRLLCAGTPVIFGRTVLYKYKDVVVQGPLSEPPAPPSLPLQHGLQEAILLQGQLLNNIDDHWLQDFWWLIGRAPVS